VTWRGHFFTLAGLETSPQSATITITYPGFMGETTIVMPLDRRGSEWEAVWNTSVIAFIASANSQVSWTVQSVRPTFSQSGVFRLYSH
jgi:hypothetical protein